MPSLPPARRPRRPRRPVHPRRAAPATRRFLLAAALAAGCGPGLQPSAGRSPEAAPTPAPEAAAAPAFAYGAGSATAIVESRATIDVADDSSAARDTVVTTARVRWRIEDAGAGERRLTAVVDSFTVRAGGRVPAAAVPLPVRVEGVVLGGRVQLGTPVGPPAPTPLAPPVPLTPTPSPAPGAAPSDTADAGCAAPAAAVLGSVRELFPTLPARLARGASWTDTVTTTACPGGVRLGATAVHHYAVAGAAEADGRRLVRLERMSEIVVRGAGAQGRQPVTADGHGTGRATLLVDVAAGRLAELAGESTIELTFTGAGRTQRVLQRATVRVQAPR